MLYGEEYRFGFNAAPDPLGRSLAGRAAGDGGRALQSLRASRDGAGAVLPQGIRCLPQRGRASRRAQPDGRGHAWSTWATCWPLPATGSGAASWRRRRGISTRITRVVLGASLPRRLSQGRLRDRARLHAQGRHAGAVLLTVAARGRVRPARRARGGGQSACGTCWRSSPTSRRSPATSSRSGTRRTWSIS